VDVNPPSALTEGRLKAGRLVSCWRATAPNQKSASGIVTPRGHPKAPDRAMGRGSGRRHPLPQVLTVPWPDGRRSIGNLSPNGAAPRWQQSGATPEQDGPTPPGTPWVRRGFVAGRPRRGRLRRRGDVP